MGGSVVLKTFPHEAGLCPTTRAGCILLCSKQDGGGRANAVSTRHVPNGSWDTSPLPGLTHFTTEAHKLPGPFPCHIITIPEGPRDGPISGWHCLCRLQAGSEAAGVSLTPSLIFFSLALKEIKSSESNSQLCIFALSHPTTPALPL